MIKLENIVKKYNGEKVLKGISFEIADGEFISIMGRSGSGKSTLLNILGGFMLPDEGSVTWDGEDIYSFTDEKTSYMRSNKVGFVFQSFKLISTLSARDNIMLTASLSKTDKGVIQKNFDAYTKRLNLDGILDKYPDELSGGQCQRVAICRALCFAPSILILDEPTGALDSENEKLVMELMRELNEKDKLTIVQVTHSQKVAEYGSKILKVQDGTIC